MDELPRTFIPRKSSGGVLAPPITHDPTIADLEMEASILGTSSMAKEAELRLQKARYKVLQKAHEALIEKLNDKVCLTWSFVHSLGVGFEWCKANNLFRVQVTLWHLSNPCSRVLNASSIFSASTGKRDQQTIQKHTRTAIRR